MFELQATAEAEGRQSEAKVWSVLIEQIWVGLPGYCWAPADLKQVRLIPVSLSQFLNAHISTLVPQHAVLAVALSVAVQPTRVASCRPSRIEGHGRLECRTCKRRPREDREAPGDRSRGSYLSRGGAGQCCFPSDAGGELARGALQRVRQRGARQPGYGR